jgi:quercetin dioxygenase-like cupin family protein
MGWKVAGMSGGGSVVPPGSGRIIRIGPNELRVKAGPEAGHTLVGVFESVMPPGGGFPFAHVHDEYEEVFYVLEGEVEYRLGETWTAASTGSAVCVPRGVVHAFRNASQQPARHLVVHAPVAALAMIDELGRAGPDQVGAVLARHRSRLVDG